MNLISWLFAVIALTGVVLNVQKLKICFWFWIVSNSGNAVYAASKGAWSLMVLFLFYLVFSIWGVIKWK